MKLRGPDHWIWLGLRRVNCGQVARLESGYYDDGRPIPGCLIPDLVEMLLERGLLTMADPDEGGGQRVTLTEAGRAEYQALCRRQRRKDPQDQVPAPVHSTTPENSAAPERGATQAPAGHQPSDSPSPAPGDRPDPSSPQGLPS